MSMTHPFKRYASEYAERHPSSQDITNPPGYALLGPQIPAWLRALVPQWTFNVSLGTAHSQEAAPQQQGASTRPSLETLEELEMPAMGTCPSPKPVRSRTRMRIVPAIGKETCNMSDDIEKSKERNGCE
jgi:hypothetical protein